MNRRFILFVLELFIQCLDNQFVSKQGPDLLKGLAFGFLGQYSKSSSYYNGEEDKY